MREITVELVRSLFVYDPITGVLFYKERVSNVAAGAEAGYINCWGYRMLSIFKKRLFAHRVIWLYVFGCWPDDEIDHINGNKADNRLSNLRAATSAQNKINRAAKSKSASGLKGVSRRHDGKWIMEFSIPSSSPRKRIRIGGFSTPEEAHNLYIEYANKFQGDYVHSSVRK